MRATRYNFTSVRYALTREQNGSRRVIDCISTQTLEEESNTKNAWINYALRANGGRV